MGKPKKPVDNILIGQKIGKWTILGIGSGTGSRKRWSVVCSCGTKTTVREDSLKSGDSMHCVRCKARMIRSKQLDIHGHTRNGVKSSEFQTWDAMIQRCHNRNSTAYKNYGGRGIIVCDRWRKSFKYFLEDMGLKPSKKHTIERIDNDRGYEPENCQWATRKEQARNNRRNVLMEFEGRTMCLTDWSREIGIPRGTITYRFKRGWSPREVLYGKAN